MRRLCNAFMTPPENASAWPDHNRDGLLVLADGTVLEGFGLGAEGHAVGEVCFNTAMTGYEEILTDPSYAGQLITFTFPHIGNVGTNDEDIETVNMAATPGARGVILRSAITDPSNYRATRHLDLWLKARGIIGLSGIDTRALTALIRGKGMPNAVIAHAKDGQFDLHGLKEEAREWPGLEGMDLVPMVTSGICLGHQMLGLAVGAKTKKMHQGHHGANHPVRDETTGKVEITSMNHGFAVDQATLPKGATQTHVSLFDGSNCGISLDGKPVFSVQYHPQASPVPRDSHYLFKRFADLMRAEKSV